MAIYSPRIVSAPYSFGFMIYPSMGGFGFVLRRGSYSINLPDLEHTEIHLPSLPKFWE